MTKKSSNQGKSSLPAILFMAGLGLILVAGAVGFDIGSIFGGGGGGEVIEDGGFVSDDWYEIFFTNPTCPPEAERGGGIDEAIARDINSAELQVDIAAFDLDSEPIIDALVAAEERGVPVRVVVDNDHNPASTTNRLRRNGMTVAEDQRSPFMHNKFVVVDGFITWMGSMNLSTNGVYCNNNNMVRLQSAELAANYIKEIDEMYIDRDFGPTSPKNTDTRIEIGGVEVENYFASEAEVAPVIARAVARADSEILFMAFSFTNEDIGEAMIERAEDGVLVNGVFEKVGSDTSFSYYRDFRRAKLDNLQVRVDGNSKLMHHKVIIIDREITIFGSFNFSNNANENNDENILIVYDPIFADYFVEEFELVWDEGSED